ncbi:MAG: type III-B CRISPR module RAMP protein Cmr6 [Promethearchaeota archaeon]
MSRDLVFVIPENVKNKLIENLENIIQSKQFNFSLFLDKFICWQIKRNASIEDSEVNIKDQIIFLNKFLKSNNTLKIDNNMLPFNLVKHYLNRQNELIKELEKQSYLFKEIKGTINWRMIINLGAASIYETSILLHRNYSIPYIPGTAIKGILNHYIQYLKDKNKIMKEDYENKFIPIFGSEKDKGKIIFFDAYPILTDIKKNIISLDVMNVHYSDYYNNKGIPGDWNDPKPIFFLSLQNITFKFVLASDESNKDYLDLADKYLKKAIQEKGIGAKTSVGYGYFKLI